MPLSGMRTFVLGEETTVEATEIAGIDMNGIIQAAVDGIGDFIAVVGKVLLVAIPTVMGGIALVKGAQFLMKYVKSMIAKIG